LFPSCSQLNNVRNLLVETWRRIIPAGSLVHLASMSGEIEDRANVNFLIDTAIEAGLPTKFLEIEQIAWNEETQGFFDQDDLPIEILFKLYPWEWMVIDSFAKNVLASTTRFIEPAWKMVLSNKAILPILWELFPEHENLLPTYTSSEPLGKTYVRKPIFSREGQNISIVKDGTVFETEGLYGEEGYIFQQFAPLPNYGEVFPVIGSWIVGGKAAGIGIRESDGLVTGNLSRFVPHVVE